MEIAKDLRFGFVHWTPEFRSNLIYQVFLKRLQKVEIETIFMLIFLVVSQKVGIGFLKNYLNRQIFFVFIFMIEFAQDKDYIYQIKQTQCIQISHFE